MENLQKNVSMMLKRMLILAMAILISVILLVFARYTAWATNWYDEPNPYDEVGISLHKMMPGFVQEWGCAQLKAEFGEEIRPPYGCSNADHTGWR